MTLSSELFSGLPLIVTMPLQFFTVHIESAVFNDIDDNNNNSSEMCYSEMSTV